MQSRRGKGLCYYCDAKYSFGHRCTSKPQTFVFYFDETLENIIGATDLVVEQVQIDESLYTNNDISLHTLSGISSSSELRFSSYLAGAIVQVLVDSGSSLNFIQNRLALHLHLPIQLIARFSVSVGNGHKLYSEGCVRWMSLLILGFKTTADLFVLPIEGADVVLGNAWLSTLGKIVHDYKNLSTQFASNGCTIVLHGDTSLLK